MESPSLVTWHIGSHVMPAVHSCYCLKMYEAMPLQSCLPRLAQEAGGQAHCLYWQTAYEVGPACRCLGSSSATLWCSFSISRWGRLSSSGSGLTLRITAAPAWGRPCSQQGMRLANAPVVGPLRCAGSGRTSTVHAPAGRTRCAGKDSRHWQPGAYARQQGWARLQAVATSSGIALTVHGPAGLGAVRGQPESAGVPSAAPAASH